MREYVRNIYKYSQIHEKYIAKYSNKDLMQTTRVNVSSNNSKHLTYFTMYTTPRTVGNEAKQKHCIWYYFKTKSVYTLT